MEIKSITNRINRVLTLVLTIAALMAGQTVWAEATWTVTNNNGNSNTFTIKRSEKGFEQTVHFRTISLSAYAGQHFTAVDMDYTFPANEDTKTVTVSESTPSGAYAYQTATSRKYGFEVTDRGGFQLAYAERSKTWGTKFTADKVSQSVTDLVYFNGTSYASGLSSSKYLDVAFTPPSGYAETSGTYSGYTLIDDSWDYAQKQATVSTSSLINSTGADATYLSSLGYKIYATVCFTMKEMYDGYYYVQIIPGDGNAAYDTGYDPNGGVNNPVNSVYKACFELKKGSSIYSGEGKWFFPHRYDHTDRSTAGQSTSHTEFYLTESYLWQHKYNSDYRDNNTGSLVLPATTGNITTRFDCNGSDDDTYGYKDLFVRMALVDATAPIKSAVSVNPGRHAKGNTVYVSVAFNEIMTVTGTPTLTTTSDNHWGSLSYVAGSGTNVLTFSTIIPQDATGALNITGLSGTVKDLAGNSLAGGTVTANSLCTLDASYAYSISYELDGGTMATENLATYTYETAAFTLNNPTRTGYTFDGWTGSNGNTPQTTVTIAAGSYDNKSYTANWTVNTYTISYDGLDGATFQTDKNSFTIESSAITLDTPTKTGYTFDGWTGSNGNTPATEVTIAAGSYDNKSYTANWTVNTYTVTLDNQGATTDGTAEVTATYGAAMPAISVPAKTGCVFWGYYTGTDGGGTKYYNADGTSAHDWDIDAATILYAWWTVVTYIDADGNEQTCTEATLLEGSSEQFSNYGADGQENWYVVYGDITYSGRLRFNDSHSHIILCDGAKLSVSSIFEAIYGNNGSITIYGQSQQSGAITATGGSVGIMAYGHVTINGGSVTASGGEGIITNYNITVNRGSVSATGNRTGISCNYVTINGGIVNATGAWDGISADGNITLGWSDASDRITASSYACSTLAVKAGQAFYDGADYYTGTLNTDQINTMAGKILQPAVTYIDENGQEQYRTDFTVLSDATIPIDGYDCGVIGTDNQDTWYVASGSYTFSHYSLNAYGHVHLILMDDAVFNVNGDSYGIYGSNLSIYGQRQGTGQLNASTSDQSGGQGAINVTNNLTIYGGTVSTTTVSGCGIRADGNVTINGGIVNATGAWDGIFADGNITLGWSNASDRITASSYYSEQGTVSVKAGQAFYDGADYYTGTLSTDQINTMAGKTLQPAVTYSITLPEHVSASGTVTRLNGTTYAPVGATVTLSTETGNILSSVTVNGTPATDNGDGTWSYSMPAQDVTVAATVTMPPVTYIDADGTEQSCTNYTLLTSDNDISNATNNQGYLSGGWYVVDGVINCYYLKFSGDVHIILADGARLDVYDGIYCYGYDLTIYGQVEGSGELSGLFSIYCNNICINGGTINNESSNTYGIYADGNVTINDGTINIENSNNYGIYADGYVTINGGTLSFNSHYAFMTSNVILASSTSLKTLNITNGICVSTISLDRTFTVGKPATLMLPFYMDVNAISGGTFYTFGGVEKENDRWVATMNEVTDYIEPNTPYLVMPTETSLTFWGGTMLHTNAGEGGQTADEGSNWTFKGTYDYIKWTTDTSDPDYTAERAAEIGRVYGFAGVQKDGIEVGDFVKVASGARIRPMSAYLMWSDTPNAQNAPMRGSSRIGSAQELPQSITVRLLDASGTVTNVGEIDTVTGEISFEGWYTLQGVKLEAEPTEPGIYINNGKTVSIQK